MVRSTLKKVMWVSGATVFMVGLSLLLALVLGVALWAGPAGAQTCPPGEPFCGPGNSPPTVDADRNSVVVQGQTATNTGTYSDDDAFGGGVNDVTITASVGNVTKTGTSSGTWSWSLANAPLGMQRVTITATDSAGESSATTFTLTGTFPNGKIAFGSAGNIYTMNPDGSGRTNLTNGPPGGTYPAYSPDGTRIAFTSYRDRNEEVYVMNANGGGLMRLTFVGAIDIDPAFSPDGSRIAFTTNRNINREVYVMGADGSNPTNLTNDIWDDYDPAFSPDGTKVAYTQDVGDWDSEIRVMNSDGSGQTNITENGANDSEPAFSPDSRKIAFTSIRDGNEEIYVMDADGTDQTRLTSNAAIDSEPVFSPDGSKIAFTSYRDGDSEIYVMNPDGTGQTNITNNTTSDTSPSWGGVSDAAPPETTVTSGPSGPVNTTSAEFWFSSSESESVFQCSFDGSPFEPCSSPQSHPNLAEGQHTFQVRTTDVSGNTDPTPAGHTWAVDTTVPETAIDSGPSGTVNSSSATFAFSSTEVNTSFECRLTKQGDTPDTFAACTSPKRQADLADGTYTFEVRARDAAGNTDQSPASRVWTVDATAPETTIETAPPPVTNSRQASFFFSSSEDDSTYECSLDGGPWQACNAPKDYANLSDGQHTFSVRARDAAGNTDQSPASRTWTVDTVKPKVTVVSPANRAKRVAPGTNLTATFSEAMKANTITKTTFKLFKVNPNGTTTQITDVTVKPSSDGLKATLNPFGTSTTLLARNTKYKAMITTGANDPAGNALDQKPSVSGNQSMVWSFTTR